ncbi:MAG: PqqD family peptide modification chaperone, partial [Pseudomonadota bacterium]
GPNACDVPPFASLHPEADNRWTLEAPLAENPSAKHNPINAICDLIVELSWERLRSQPDLLCLHAAALKFGGSLVLFPNARRAGKSVLTATLAQLGHDMFSDDFVPLAVNHETGVISGMANGIAPRLRLPLPENLTPGLREWITGHIGPANKQYGYLTGIDLPTSGTLAPVGAVVVLERVPDLAEPASLTPVGQDAAMAALVSQNFGRHVHAGAILQVTDALTRSVPVLRLRYDRVEEAAELLNQSAVLHDLPAAQMPQMDQPGPLPLAPLDTTQNQDAAEVDLDATFAQVPGFTQVQTEASLYLADARGVTIHRLNPVSNVIWALLDAPLTGVEMVDVLQELYPDVGPAQLRKDALSALQFMVQRHLVAEVPGA